MCVPTDRGFCLKLQKFALESVSALEGNSDQSNVLPGKVSIGVDDENAATNTETQKTHAVSVDDVTLLIS